MTPSNKSLVPLASIIVSLSFALEGCRAVAGIFKAGVWLGVVIAVVLVALIGGLFSMMKR